MATPIKRAPFRLGTKQLFLPNFVLTLVRNPPSSPPTFASFIVPLNLNKFDLRDYLYNCYGVRARGIRSFIQQQKVTHDKPNNQNPVPRRWFRARAVKRMMVEMDEPFVWPEAPTNFDAWDQKTRRAVSEWQEEGQQRQDSTFVDRKAMDSVKAQASEILESPDSWRASGQAWANDGPEEEVETDVVLPEAGEAVAAAKTKP